MITICASDAVGEGEIIRVDVAGFAPLAVARHEGQIYLFPDRCPHAEESLSEGWLEDGRVICAVHFAEFDLTSGEVHNRPVGCPNLNLLACSDQDGQIVATLKELA